MAQWGHRHPGLVEGSGRVNARSSISRISLMSLRPSKAHGTETVFSHCGSGAAARKGRGRLVELLERTSGTGTLADRLRQRIARREAVVGLIGLGYAGLPLAVAFAEAGFNV